MTEEKKSDVGQTAHYAELQAQIEQHKRRTKELEALMTVQTAISSSLALTEILERALDTTLAVTEMEAGEIFLLDAAAGAVSLARQRGVNGELFGERTQFALGEGIPGWVAQTGEVVVIPDLAADSRFLRRKVVDAGFKTFAAFPLRAKGEVVGCLTVATRQTRTLTEDDQRLLTSIGAAVGMAVANAHLYGRLTCAVQQLEAKLEELQRIQNRLVAAERLRGMGKLTTSAAGDLNNVVTVLRMLSSFN